MDNRLVRISFLGIASVAGNVLLFTGIHRGMRHTLNPVNPALFMGLSKKLRFEVFKRDAFTCQYCGCNPPSVVLEVDHIQPISKNGTDEIDNLVTSCFDCNRGKGARELTTLPQSTIEKTSQLLEKEEQYLEYKKVLAKIKRRIQNEINCIDKVYTSYFPDWVLNDRFKNGSLSMFIKTIGFSKVEQAMHTACARINDENKAIKYFCGICWNRINDKGNGQAIY